MKLVIIRGVPGTGKSTLAAKLIKDVPGARHVEADMFFVDGFGNYNWDPKKIKQAHEWCQLAVLRGMDFAKAPLIVVSNTFTRHWEYQPYVDMAKTYGYEVEIITLEEVFGNIHKVPEETVLAMQNRFEK